MPSTNIFPLNDNNSFTISIEEFDQPSLKTSLININNGLPITLEKCRRRETNNHIRIRGRTTILENVAAEALFLGILNDDASTKSIMIRFRIIDRQSPNDYRSLHSLFKNLPIVPSNFNYSFSRLSYITKETTDGDLLNSLGLSNIFLIISTEEVKNPRSGVLTKADLWLTANYKINLPIEGLPKLILGSKKNGRLSGRINFPPSSSGNKIAPLDYRLLLWEKDDKSAFGFNLASNMGFNLQLGPSSLDSVLMQIYTPTSKDWLKDNPSYQPIYGLVAHLTLIDDITCTVTCINPSSDDALTFAGKFENVNIENLARLSGLFQDKDLLEALPDELKQVSNLELKTIQVTLSDKEIQSMTIGIGYKEVSIQSVIPNLEIKNLTAYFRIPSPRNKYLKFNTIITGDMEYCGAILNTSLDVQSKLCSASLRLDESLDLSKIANEVGLDVGDSLPFLDIENAFVLFSHEGLISFNSTLKAKDSWTISVGKANLSLEELSLSIQKEDEKYSASISSKAVVSEKITLMGNFDFSGNMKIKGMMGSVKLSEMVHAFLQTDLIGPDGFDLTFEQSSALIQKQAKNYELKLGTTVKDAGSLFFVVQKHTNWGFATGLNLDIQGLSKFPIAGKEIDKFTTWFPFDSFTLVVSEIESKDFSFPAVSEFDQSSNFSLSPVKLPSTANGIEKGFFLYTSTEFRRDKKVMALLMDLLKIPTGKQLSAFFEYQTEKKKFTLGLALKTYLTAAKDDKKPKNLPYKNSQLVGVMGVEFGGEDKFGFSLNAHLQTMIKEHELDFDVSLLVQANGAFVAGSMTSPEPIDFGPLQIGGIAVELGISYEGVPSFGFSGEIAVGDFNSSLAIIVDSVAPENSMIAGVLSDINVGDVLDHMLGDLEDLNFPLAEDAHDIVDQKEISTLLRSIEITGSKDGAFTVAKDKASDFTSALKNYEGTTVADYFNNNLKTSDFPTKSPDLIIFSPGDERKDRDNKKWFITEQSKNSIITYWQLVEQDSGIIAVSKEVQLYFAPTDTNIGTFTYHQGMMITGRISFLSFKVEVDIELEPNKGLSINAEMTPIVLGTKALFSITAAEGDGGPSVNICTYNRPDQPKEFQSPHFFINGQTTLLGSGFGILIYLSASGAKFKINATRFEILKLNLSGIFDNTKLEIGGEIHIGLKEIDLGPIGSVSINTGVSAISKIWANTDDFGASFSGEVEILGEGISFELKLKVETQTLEHLVELVADKVKYCFYELGKDVVTAALKGAGYAAQKVGEVLKSVYGLGSDAAAATLKEAGYAAKEVGEALNSVYGLGSIAAAATLKEAGYAAKEVGEALNSVYGLGSDAAAATLKEAGYDAVKIKNVIDSLMNPFD